jgi:hypothetical protein
MSKSSSPSKTGRRQFHAQEVNTSICKAIRDVRQRAKRKSLDTDAELIMACAVAADIWRHHDRLFSDLSEIKDDALRARVAATLWNAVNPVLQQVCDLHTTTREGYRARAAVFLMWDAGEMLARAETGRIMDRLNLAIVMDLL